MSQENPTNPKGLSGAEAARAEELVSYQNGSIVSREIVKKPNGNVTVFAFDTGQGMSEHTSPFDALVHVLDGEAEVSIGGKARRVQSGEVILMPANQPHALNAAKRFKMILTMIRS